MSIWPAGRKKQTESLTALLYWGCNTKFTISEGFFFADYEWKCG